MSIIVPKPKVPSAPGLAEVHRYRPVPAVVLNLDALGLEFMKGKERLQGLPEQLLRVHQHDWAVLGLEDAERVVIPEATRQRRRQNQQMVAWLHRSFALLGKPDFTPFDGVIVGGKFHKDTPDAVMRSRLATIRRGGLLVLAEIEMYRHQMALDYANSWGVMVGEDDPVGDLAIWAGMNAMPLKDFLASEGVFLLSGEDVMGDDLPQGVLNKKGEA